MNKGPVIGFLTYAIRDGTDDTPSTYMQHAGIGGCRLEMAATIMLPNIAATVKESSQKNLRQEAAVVAFGRCFHESKHSFAKTFYCRICILHVARPSLIKEIRGMAWPIYSSADGSRLDTSSSSSANGGTRLIKAFQEFQRKLGAKVQELRKNLPIKLLFFLAGFYCATAFSTVIGQTGDWDILSAALAVVVVEGIGALMYRGSLPIFNNIRNLITLFNYWKAGLSLGLFLDSFKY